MMKKYNKKFVFDLNKRIVMPLKLKKGETLKKRFPKGIKIIGAKNINEAIRKQARLEIRKELKYNKKIGLI